jgi:hypothetical protein
MNMWIVSRMTSAECEPVLRVSDLASAKWHWRVESVTALARMGSGSRGVANRGDRDVAVAITDGGGCRTIEAVTREMRAFRGLAGESPQPRDARRGPRAGVAATATSATVTSLPG